MDGRDAAGWSRRDFLGGLTVAGTAGFLGLRSHPAAAEPPPETTRLRVMDTAEICMGTPLLVAEDLLKGEGFSDVQYVKMATGPEGYKAVASGDLDFSIGAAPSLIPQLDAGAPFLFLAGAHVGCFELFGTDRIRSARDLKGKSVAVTQLGSGRHAFLAMMAAHVGLDPRRDIRLVTDPAPEAVRLFAGGRIDAFMGFPPEPQELRAKKIGRVLVNTTTDKPWSQYFCCMLFTHRDFARKYPIATKRALRAIVKAADVCAHEPEQAARIRARKGHPDDNGYALQTMKELPYNTWREYDPEDTVRFYALRLHEVGMIKGSPQKIIAQGTDWRFLNELKKELKG